MQIRSAAALLGTGAAILSTVAFVPQITKIWRTGGKDVSLFMLWLYGAGVTLWLCYGLAIGAAALSLANAVSIVFAGACLVLKLMKERQTHVRMEKKRCGLRSTWTKPLRIASKNKSAATTPSSPKRSLRPIYTESTSGSYALRST
jgi:MtN3 and saliva related transmembrane protein